MEKTVPQAQFVVNAQGKKTGVLLSLKQYEIAGRLARFSGDR